MVYTEEELDEIIAEEKADRIMEEDIDDAYNFINKYYPGLWDRVGDEDLVQLLALGYTLFKRNPQILEETTKTRQSPTQ